MSPSLINNLKKSAAVILYGLTLGGLFFWQVADLEGNTFTFWDAAIFSTILFLFYPLLVQLGLFKDKDFLKLHFIACGTGLLLALAWPPLPTAFIIFGAFLPLLYVEHLVSNPNSKYYGHNFFRLTYSAILLWNILSTYWVANSHIFGGVFAFTVNTFVMCLPWFMFHLTKKRFGAGLGYISLVAYWLAFEYLHMQWDLSWPWLTIGNAFASVYPVVQWYEFTGHLGGTLWVLMVNCLFFYGIAYFAKTQHWFGKRFRLEPLKARKYAAVYVTALPALLVVLPVAISLWMYAANDPGFIKGGKKANVTVLQPNIDPYNEKFSGSPDDILAKMIALSEKGITPKTDYLVWPETSIPAAVWVDRPYQSQVMLQVAAFLHKHPDITLITGAMAREKYDHRATTTTRTHASNSDTLFYDVFNAALQMEDSLPIQDYRKSKLVPGVEKMPYPGLLGLLGGLAIDLGGISGSLGEQADREVFFNRHHIGIAPVICYESIYGDYVTEYVRNGAEAIFIITNDGWWSNSAGHKQHVQYASLRAIETRRDIARSANTGISCFVNRRGDILQATNYWEPAVISSTIQLSDAKTFFVRYGDYLGRTACFLTIFFVLMTFVRKKISSR
ncbi:apolipoprotein N-acyltransferase [soil metagenome]